MKLRVLVGSLLVWGSFPGLSMPGRSMPGSSMSGRTMQSLGTLALSGSKSSCAFSPSLEHSKKIEESPSSQERKSDKKADAEQLARA